MPSEAIAECQSRLVDWYHNTLNTIQSEGTGEETILHHLYNVKAEIIEIFQECCYGKYRMQMLAFLDTLKRYLEMPLVSMITLPLIDFIKLLENEKLWNECSEELRTKYGSQLYLDLGIERLKKSLIDLFVEAPTMYEVTTIKKIIEDYIKKVITPEVKVTSPEVKGQGEEVTKENSNKTDNEKVVSQKNISIQEGSDGKQIYTVEETIHLIQVQNSATINEAQHQRAPQVVMQAAPQVATQEVTSQDNNNNTEHPNAENIAQPAAEIRSDSNQTNTEKSTNSIGTNTQNRDNSETTKISFVRSKSVPAGHQAIQQRPDNDNINFINIDIGSGDIINETTKAIHRSVSQVLILHLDSGVVS